MNYPGIYPQGDPLGASPILKTNYITYTNKLLNLKSLFRSLVVVS